MKFIKTLTHYFRKKGNLLNIISIRAFSYSHKYLKVKYKSKLLNLNFPDVIKIYKIKDTIINVKLNCVLKNNVTIKNIKIPIIAESIKNNFYSNLLYNPNLSQFENIKNIKVNKNINTTKDIYYFDVLENKPNYYHFIIDNFINLLLFIENYNKNYLIVFNADISKYINSFMNLIPKVYNIKILPIKKSLNFVGVKNNLIFSEALIYQKVIGFEKNYINKDKIKMIDPKFSIYNYPTKYKSPEGKTIYNRNIENITSKNSFEIVDLFIKKLISKKIIKKTIKYNYYIRREKNIKNKLKNRLVHEEEKLIKYLKNKNFKIISFENKNIKDQIEIILNSNVVIGIHGANLTNTVFKEKGGSVIELFPFDSTRDGCHYEYIAEQRKLKFFRINCKENNNGILVNYSELSKVLKKAL